MASCLFCNIAKGFEPTEVVLENDTFMAFHDLFPKADHHLLVIPREHHEHLDSFVASGGDGQALLRFVRDVAEHQRIAGGYRVLANVGPDAGQVIMHMHLHLLAGTRVTPF